MLVGVVVVGVAVGFTVGAGEVEGLGLGEFDGEGLGVNEGYVSKVPLGVRSFPCKPA